MTQVISYCIISQLWRGNCRPQELKLRMREQSELSNKGQGTMPKNQSFYGEIPKPTSGF